MVALDTLAGILVVLGAAWLVWTRPGGMTWGFFVYVIQFNPGQAFQLYAWLQQWPLALLVQDVVSLVMQAAAYTGLLLFALRAPVDRAEGRWRAVERALPALATLFLLTMLPSLGTVFGYRAEIWLRSSLMLGFAVSVAALGILLGRRRRLSPRDYQRIRWVIWGCLIGLPAYLLAELSQETSLLTGLLGEGVAPEEVAGLLYLINGVLCLFVAEAVRRPTVINVWIPLRRATVLGLLLSVPVLFLHKQIETIDEYIHMPDWAWVLVASGLVYVLARAHEFRPSSSTGCSIANLSAPSDVSPPWERPFSMPTASPRSSASWWRRQSVPSSLLRRRYFANRMAYSAGASAPDGTRTTPIRSPATSPCLPQGSAGTLRPQRRRPYPRVPCAPSGRLGATDSRRAGGQFAALLRARPL